MREKPKLQVTRNYDVFEMHEHNRPLHEDPVLLASMRKRGFDHAEPIRCRRNGSGKLKVEKGHHRLEYAKRLSLPVWYIVADSNADIFDLEGGRQAWSATDFLRARAIGGNPDCAKVIDFQKKHGLTLGAATSLLGGQSAGSGNMVRAVKQGTFKVSADTAHAHTVVSITDHCRACGLSFAASSGFVAAVSMCARVPEFDVARFKHRIKLHGFVMRKRATKDDYVDEIDALYNYGAKTQRVPLAFKAREVSRQRQETFGGKMLATTKAKKKS